MSKLPGVTQTLELLDRLRDALREMAQSEDELATQLAQAQASAQRSHEAAGTRVRQQATEQAAALARETAARRDHCEAVHARRRRAIDEGLLADRRRATQRIDQEESRRKYRVQEGSLQAERRREADTAAADATLGDFRLRHSESDQSLAQTLAVARRAFRGYGSLRRLLQAESAASLAGNLDEEQHLAEANSHLTRASAALDAFRRRWGPRVFGACPLGWYFFGLAVAAATVIVLPRFGLPGLPWPQGAAAFGAAVVVLLVAFLVSRSQVTPAARGIAEDLARSRQLLDAAAGLAEQRHANEHARITAAFEATTARLRADWGEALEQAAALRACRPRELEAQARRATARNDSQRQARLTKLESEAARDLAAVQSGSVAQESRLAATRDSAQGQFLAQTQAAWEGFETEWRGRLEAILSALDTTQAGAAAAAPAWNDATPAHWQPATAFPEAVPFGRLEVSVGAWSGVELAGRRLASVIPAVLAVPLVLRYPDEGSLLFETGEAGGTEAVAAINQVIFRLLAATPPGKLSLTIIDPVGLGQSFAGLMHLADYDEDNIHSRIWTQSAQIEERLAELAEHMEKVIQMYLRDEYATIAEYNQDAGTIAEKYHLLVIAGFPVNFSDVAARRLMNIAASGARCGVFTLIQWDGRHPLPLEAVGDELRQRGVRVIAQDNRLALAERAEPGLRLVFDAPPPPEVASDFLRQLGERSRGASRVEVPFSQVAPSPEATWSLDTTEELRVPIGRSGATKLQYLALGRGTRQHGLIAGKTGSGKSTLFHVIITNLASWCSPEAVEFYLVDFKKGVEFKCYAAHRLPHARVVAIESDRDFGLSVLQRVDEELGRRGELFRQRGVQDLAGYCRAGGAPLPRTVLVIDEFQEFFTEEDRVSQGAAVLLDRLVRQGRAFGIHVLLGSQTLGGAYTLARATLGQMVVRVALQCNEADAYLILDENNPAPRLLSRPGEGIYNDTGGSLEGNSPFQTVWLPEDERDSRLAAIATRAASGPGRAPGPMVFEGNAPADVRDNPLFTELLAAPIPAAPTAPRCWLGAPNSIKGPTEAVFRRQAGDHLLIVGQREDAAVIMVGLGLLALAAQYPPGGLRLVLVDSTPVGTAERALLDRVVAGLPHPCERVAPGNVTACIRHLAGELTQRSAPADGSGTSGSTAPDVFAFILGLQHCRRLRPEDDFAFGSTSDAAGDRAATEFLELVADGPAQGIHFVATGDTWGNLGRFLGRKALAGFARRVLFQMSANDSASLIDAPDASRLGLHRAILFNEQAGSLETFRPYSMPDPAWLETAAQALAQRAPLT